MSPPATRAGTTLGPYTIEALLGRGGMGEVYRAVDTRRGRTVALKLLTNSIADDSVARERFLRESRVAAALTDPHVIPIHDWGEVDGQLYIDMRLVVGRDLRRVIADDGPMPGERACHIVEQIGSALDAAHQAGLIHRDVKPDNILVDANDFAYLVDFGLAVTDADTRFTQGGYAVGSFRYMAPERFGADEIAPAADIYALTCVLYECLAGAAPFAFATSAEQIMAAHLTRDPEPLGDEIDRVIARGMAKQPSARYSSAAALVADGRAALSSSPARPRPHPNRTYLTSPVTQPEASRDYGQTPATAAQFATTTLRPVKRRTARALTVGATVVALLLAVGIGGWFLVKPSNTVPHRNSASPTTHTVTATHSVTPTTTTLTTTPAAATAPATDGKIVWHTTLGSAKLQLWLSTDGYNWVTVTSSGGSPADARVWSAATGWQHSPVYPSAPTSFAMPRVYAPGDTCIRIIANYGAASLNRKLC